MRELSLCVLVATVAVSPGVCAQEAVRDKPAAEALFAEGRRLMLEGRYSEACPKLEASQRSDPGIGTMLNLAECYEKLGKTASAWAEFREVVSAARAAESPEREELARRRAQELEPRLSRLTIQNHASNASTVGFEIRRDGKVLDAAEIGSAIPVDPGKHVVEATAPGKQRWVHEAEVNGEGVSVTLEIPALQAAAEGASSSFATATSSSGDPAGSFKVLPIAVGAAGLVGLGVGTYFGLRASSTWDDAKDACADFPYECGERGKGLQEDASRDATISTIGFVVGGVGLAAGAILWFTMDSPSNTQVGLAPGRVSLKGTF